MHAVLLMMQGMWQHLNMNRTRNFFSKVVGVMWCVQPTHMYSEGAMVRTAQSPAQTDRYTRTVCQYSALVRVSTHVPGRLIFSVAMVTRIFTGDDVSSVRLICV